jgi:hypothetical protein
MSKIYLAQLATLRRMSFALKIVLRDLSYPPRPTRLTLRTLLASLPTREPLPFLRTVVLLLLA